MRSFGEHYYLMEIADSKRNREDIIRAYGLLDNSNPATANERAKEIIDKWTKLEPLIDPKNDYFGNISNGKKYNPRDIFSWSYVSRDLGHDKMEALQNLEAMLANLRKGKEKKDQFKSESNDYEQIYPKTPAEEKTALATIRRPKNEATSCRLGNNTAWCISGKDNNQWEYYKSQGVTMVFILSRIPKEVHDGTKWAVAFSPDGTIDAYDETDHRMEYEELQSILADHNIPITILDRFKPDVIDAIRSRSFSTMQKISGAVRYPGNPETLLNKLLSDVLNISDKDMSRFQAFRKEEGYPDQTFDMIPLHRASVRFFTHQHLNPPGGPGNTISQRSMNDLWQESIVQGIKRLAHTTKQAQSNPQDESWVNDMDDETDKYHRLEEEWDKVFNGISLLQLLIDYCRNHMPGKWPELEAALLDLWEVNYNATDFNRSDDPTRDTDLWLRVILGLRGGRWEALEEYITGKLEVIISKPDPGRKLRELLDWGKKYNQQSAVASGNRNAQKLDSNRAWVPETLEQLKSLINDRDSYQNNTPHTTRAAEEIRWRKSFNKSKS
jgi:hypothetical protein